MVETNLIAAHESFPSFSEKQARELAIALSKIAEEAEKSRFAKLATKEDFTELKQIVANLGVAQQKTEQRLEKLAERVDDLAIAQ